MAFFFEHAAPMDPTSIEGLAEQWRTHGAMRIGGPRGSGRRSLALALLDHAEEDIPVRRCEITPGSGTMSGWLLEELGLAPAHEAMRSPVTHLARRIAARTMPSTILVHGVDHADPRSVRVLLALSRLQDGTRVILIGGQDASSTDPTATAIDIPVQVDLAPITGERIEEIVEHLLGARPTDLDVARLEVLAGGSFRALCWTLDLASRTGRLAMEHGFVHLPGLEDLDLDLPSWSIREDLVRRRPVQLIALAGGLPVRLLEDLGLLAEVVALEAAGDLRIDEGIARLPSRALALEAAARITSTCRRLRLTRILSRLRDEELQAVDPVLLARWAERSQMPVGAALASAAVQSAARSGRHREAARLASLAVESLDGEGRRDLVFSLTVLDRTQEATSLVREILTSDPAADLESLGMTMALGTMRRPERVEYLQTLREVTERAQRTSAATVTILVACAGLLRPGPDMGVAAVAEVAASSTATDRARECALELLAAHAWADGRPRAAIRYFEDLGGAEASSAVSYALRHTLRPGCELMTPSVTVARRLLQQDAANGSIPTTTRFTRAAVAINRGSIATALLVIAPAADPESEDCDPALLAMAAAIASIAASFLDQGDRAESYIDLSDDTPVTSMVIGAATEHLRGLAASQLRPTPHTDEAITGYAAASMAARTMNFRLLETIANYRWAHALNVEERTEQWDWLVRQLDGPLPLDGMPAVFARMARGIRGQDVRSLVEMVSELSAAELVQDAKVLSEWLVGRVSQQLPFGTRRSIARIARHRPASGAVRSAELEDFVLTPKEREVADLILEGLTDRDIGERLGISRRTVTTHVGRILRKLGIGGRHELTEDIARRRGMSTT